MGFVLCIHCSTNDLEVLQVCFLCVCLPKNWTWWPSSQHCVWEGRGSGGSLPESGFEPSISWFPVLWLQHLAMSASTFFPPSPPAPPSCRRQLELVLPPEVAYATSLQALNLVKSRLDSIWQARKFLHPVFAHPRCNLGVDSQASIALAWQWPDLKVLILSLSWYYILCIMQTPIVMRV